MRSLVPLTEQDACRLICPWCGRAARGTGGFRVVRGGATIGAAVLAPPERGSDLCPPRSAVLSRLWVRPDDVGEHVGTQLVQRVCAELLASDLRHLVAYGTRGRPDCAHLPVGWLAVVGFADHGGTQWRIDLRRAAPSLGFVRDAASGLLRGWRPGRDKPAPANRG